MLGGIYLKVLIIPNTVEVSRKNLGIRQFTQPKSKACFTNILYFDSLECPHYLILIFWGCKNIRYSTWILQASWDNTFCITSINNWPPIKVINWLTGNTTRIVVMVGMCVMVSKENNIRHNKQYSSEYTLN